MTAVLLVLLLQATIAPPIWPVTVSGWITFVASVATLGYLLHDRLVAKVKRDEALNGLGARVNAAEDWQKKFDAGATERALIQQEIVHTQQELLKEIGEAKALAATCHADTEKMTRELTKLIESKHDQSDAWERRVSMQLANLITELATRGQIAAQPPASPPLPRPHKRTAE